MENYCTVDEVAELLRVDRRTVIAAIERGELPAIQIGRQYRLSKKDLEELKKLWNEREGS